MLASVVLLLLVPLLVDALILLVGRRDDGRCLSAVLFLAGRLVIHGVYIARAPCRIDPPTHNLLLPYIHFRTLISYPET